MKGVTFGFTLKYRRFASHTFTFTFLVTNMQALGEPLEKKQPWQNIVAICTTHLRSYLFDAQYVVAALLLLLVTNMQALGKLLEKKQPWQKHCSNLHHWHLSPYPFRYSICSGRATVAQFFFLYFHTYTHTHIPPFFFFLFFLFASDEVVRLQWE